MLNMLYLVAYDHNNGKATPTYHGFMTKRLNRAACLAVSSNSEGYKHKS